MNSNLKNKIPKEWNELQNVINVLKNGMVGCSNSIIKYINRMKIVDINEPCSKVHRLHIKVKC